MGLPDSREALPNGSGSIVPSSTILLVEDCLIALKSLLTGKAQGVWPTNLALAGNLLIGGQPLSFADFTVTADPATDRLAKTAHGLQTGDGPVRGLNTGGALPGGLAPATDYFAIRNDAAGDDADHFRVATSRANAIGGIAVDITSAGTGTQTIQHQAGTTRVSDCEVTRNLIVDGTLTVAVDSTTDVYDSSSVLPITSGFTTSIVNHAAFWVTPPGTPTATGRVRVPVGRRITAWSVLFRKTTTNTTTLTAYLFDVGPAAAGASPSQIGAPQPTSANAPGSVSVGQSGLSAPVSASTFYQIVIESSGAGGDDIIGYTVTHAR